MGQRIMENWQLYLLLLIPVVLTVIYKYIPMYGIQIAFRDYKASRGITGSKWVGLEWFERFYTAPTCGRMISNTILLSLFSLLWSFPIPIILSLCINQLRFPRYKRVVQTVLYAPHFISIMVVCGMVRIFLSPFLIHIVMLKGIIKVGHCFDVFSVSSAAFHGPGQEKTGNQNAEDSLQVSGKTRSAHGRTPF